MEIRTVGWTGELAFVEAGVVFRGEVADNRPHRHATVQLTLGLDGPVTMTEVSSGVAARAMCGPALLVRPNVMHALQPGGRVLLALLAPETRIAQALLQHQGAGGVVALAPDVAARIDTKGSLGQALSALQPPPTGVPPFDARVQQALAFLESSQGPRPIERAAAATGLSVSRLRALARDRLEVPLARWLTLRQLQRAVVSLARGASLAEAAFDAGFADQAHLTSSMRRTLGVTPGTVATIVRATDRRFVQDPAQSG
jgi:AraC family transcriptional regulator of arabinose operon